MLIRNGSTGSQVQQLQRELKAAGCDPGGADGIFGTKTQAAVKAYQKQHDLAADGLVGSLTWKSLMTDGFDPPKSTTPTKPTTPTTPTTPPVAGGTGAAGLAEKYLGKRESQLQAAGVTKKGVPTDVCCANFVSSMLQKSGQIDFHDDRVGGVKGGGLADKLMAEGWRKVPAKDAKPGDVWINPGHHTELVAKNQGGKVTLIGSNNHPNPNDQTIGYDTSSAKISGSYILSPP